MNPTNSCPPQKPQPPKPSCPKTCPRGGLDLYGWLLWQLGLKRCSCQDRCSGWQKRAGCGKRCD